VTNAQTTSGLAAHSCITRRNGRTGLVAMLKWTGRPSVSVHFYRQQPLRCGSTRLPADQSPVTDKRSRPLQLRARDAFKVRGD